MELFLKGERALNGKSALERRGDAPPGQHGQARRRKPSIYQTQLRAKQTAKRYYGVRERQFRRYVYKANRAQGVTGEELLSLLERRLDNVVYRLGFAGTRAQARQFVNHGHVTVDDKKVDIASYLVKPGQTVAIHGPVREVASAATELTGVGQRLAADGLRGSAGQGAAAPGAVGHQRAGERAADRRALLAPVSHRGSTRSWPGVARDLGRDLEGRRVRARLAGDRAAARRRAGRDRPVSRLCARSHTVTRCCSPTCWAPARATRRASRWSAAAAAQRARLAVEVVGAGDGSTSPIPDATLVVDPAGGEILDGRELGVDLLWRCAHETVATVLDRVAERAERAGDLALAMAARAVTLTLPLEDDSRSYRVDEHRRLLARLN